MLKRKTDPVGLDVLIDRLQVKLSSELNALWGDENFETLAFPRCYVNDKDGKKNIQHYADKDEYTSTVLYAENTKFFFTQEESIIPVDTEGFEANVNLYFIVDLREVKNNRSRDDYHVLNDVVIVIKNQSSFTINNIETDFKNIFRNTDFIDESDNMNPYYCFMISLKSYRFETDLKKCAHEQ